MYLKIPRGVIRSYRFTTRNVPEWGEELPAYVPILGIHDQTELMQSFFEFSLFLREQGSEFRTASAGAVERGQGQEERAVRAVVGTGRLWRYFFCRRAKDSPDAATTPRAVGSLRSGTGAVRLGPKRRGTPGAEAAR